MPMEIKIFQRGATPDLIPRALKHLTRTALKAGAELWVKKFIPKHFQRSAIRRYEYTPRKGEKFARGTREFWDSYSGSKLNKKTGPGHLIPLVHSGKTKASALRSKVKLIAVRAQVVTRAPALNFRPRNSTINMREEFQTLLPQEHEEIAREMERAFQSELDILKTRDVRPVGSRVRKSRVFVGQKQAIAT